MSTVKFLGIIIISALPALVLAADNNESMPAMPMHQGADMNMMGHDHNHGHEHHGNDHGGMFGKPGIPAQVNRTIEIDMSDNMRFDRDLVKIKVGDTVHFVVKNKGKIDHEMVIVSMAELKEHAALMRKMPGMKHNEPNMVSVAPGKTGNIIWKFDKAGTVNFACLVPGHWEAGMKGKILVQHTL